jgi:hypothetical protein
MVIVEFYSDFQKFLTDFQTNPSVIIPILEDSRAHPVNNRVCLLFVSTKTENYVLPFHHNESLNLPIEYLDELVPDDVEVFAPNAKLLSHVVGMSLGKKLIDLHGIEHLLTGTIVEAEHFYTPFIRQMIGTYRKISDIWTAIPLMSILEFCETYLAHLRTFVEQPIISEPSFRFHNKVILPTCEILERNGVAVNPILFTQYYGDRATSDIVEGKVFTEYNPYTTTRRVTNKFNGINYSAIEKGTGIRHAFVSRFAHGKLVLIDWESFHIRLIADLIDYDLPSEPAHQFFAKQYFQSDAITPEQYAESKQITFQNLYGQGTSQIEFFELVRSYIDLLWTEIHQTGWIETYEGNRVLLKNIEHPNPGKVLNYLLQLRETEVAFNAMAAAVSFLESCVSKATLYTYDSILFDVDLSEFDSVIPQLRSILECGGKYPVRAFAGQNYEQLELVK